ncbi:UNKNOWN [Stylonychia lemnae]|uniref:Prolyl 4-hydroxylase alpha subunit domain-containing protein n=1 Tax=Stylonychia lemnae TaxID=5949 RepID=A0A077ZYM0_STYLE|nr:UNKNOWN [Stylonychia lemnae]|eukprot:CDW75041.1 UNKNOWN [Stylonychia lemnae]
MFFSSNIQEKEVCYSKIDLIDITLQNQADLSARFAHEKALKGHMSDDHAFRESKGSHMSAHLIPIYLAQQFLGMERILFDDSKKLDWKFFSNHLLNMQQNKKSQQQQPMLIPKKASTGPSNSPPEQADFVYQLFNQKFDLDQYKKKQNKEVLNQQLVPNTVRKHLKTKIFKDKIDQDLKQHFKTIEVGKLNKKEKENVDYGFQTICEIIQKPKIVIEIENQQNTSEVLNDSSESLYEHGNNFKFRRMKQQLQDKDYGTKKESQQTWQKWRHYSIQDQKLLKCQLDDESFMDQQQNSPNIPQSIDYNDPLDLGNRVDNLVNSKPLFFYVRRKSCCCRDCKMYKELKGLNIVLESDLIGKKLQFKNLIAKATQILSRKATQAKIINKNTLNDHVQKRFKSQYLDGIVTQSLQNFNEKQNQVAQTPVPQVADKRSKVTNLRSIVIKDLTSKEKLMHQYNQQYQTQPQIDGNSIDSEESQIEELEEIFQQEIENFRQSQGCEESDFKKLNKFFSARADVEKNLNMIRVDSDDQRSGDKSKRAVQSRYRKSILENSKQRTARAFTINDHSKQSSLFQMMDFNRQVSLRKLGNQSKKETNESPRTNQNENSLSKRTQYSKKLQERLLNDILMRIPGKSQCGIRSHKFKESNTQSIPQSTSTTHLFINKNAAASAYNTQFSRMFSHREIPSVKSHGKFRLFANTNRNLPPSVSNRDLSITENKDKSDCKTTQIQSQLEMEGQQKFPSIFQKDVLSKRSSGSKKHKTNILLKNKSAKIHQKDNQQTQKALLSLFKHSYVDVSKIIGHFDQNKSTEFKKKNNYFHVERLKSDSHKSKHGSNNDGCCSAVNKINQSFTNISNRGKQQGLDFDEQTQKEILSKCMYESVNKIIYEHVKKNLVQEEQCYSKQPGLFAHPSAIKAMKDGKLNQLDEQFIKDLQSNGYGIKQDFIYEKGLIEKVVSRLTLLEIEGKFQIQKSLLPLEQRIRNDKVLPFNINEIEKIDEFAQLHKITKLVYFLPFELNMHLNYMQLQITDHFEASYFGGADHNQHKLHADSGFGEFNTGLKITVLLIINDDKSVDSDYGQLIIEQDGQGNGSEGGEQVQQKAINLRNNTLVVLMSRKVRYEIKDVKSKVYVIKGLISGPEDPNKLC